jgi:hypothetical protein
MMILGFFLKFIVGLIAFAIAVFVAICLQGPVSTWVRQFALLFYGGRYPALGDLLYPPLVAPVAPIVPVVPGTPGVV